MTNPSEDLLATTEGVDEGSAKSTVEGAASTEELTGVTNPIKRALGDPDRTDEQSESSPAPPLDLGIDPPRGPGQQLEAGEG
jgi:hypothetical protein